MILHIFNPEHDIALAANLSNFTAPHAGRQLRNDLGFLPALWAAEGDQILVQHEESALKAYRRVCHRLVKLGVTDSLPSVIPQFTAAKVGVYRQETQSIQPWGWDRAIRRELERMGMDATLLPADAQIEQIRQLSHRRTSAQLLSLLQMEGTVGEAFECTTIEQVEELFLRYGRVVLKAPWSSSGRGVRFCDAARLVNSEERIVNNAARLNDKGEMINEKWVRNVIASQGSIMVEPYYNKVKDFGMEFEAAADGSIRYLGLSLFHTVNGAYVGNILATESVKCDMISRYITACLLDSIKQKITKQLRLPGYVGPFGIDMMVVKNVQRSSQRHTLKERTFNVQCSLHPCVEINLRRTMGHVALSISPKDDDIRGVMRVLYDGSHYKLKINKLR